MDNTISVLDILNSLENIGCLYPNKMPINILKEQIELTKDKNKDKVKDRNNALTLCRGNLCKGNLSWGNKDANILILGSIEDKQFKESSKLWQNILNNGMKLDGNLVFCVSASNYLDIDLSKYRFVLCLGYNAKLLLEEKLKFKLPIYGNKKLYCDNGLKIMSTYDITRVNEDIMIKRAFWNDLKMFLKEIV
ncbi:MAG: hypothetical protein ACOX3T_02775 [Bdellovibrionota bacterium]